MPSTTAGTEAEVALMCMIPLMWAPYFIEGGTPKLTLDKIQQLVAASPAEYRPAFAFIRDWGRYSCLAAGAAAPGVHRPSVAVAWRDFPKDRQYTEWVSQSFRAVYRIPDQHRAAATPAVGGAGVKDAGASIAAAILVAGMQGASQLERDKKEKYAHYEKMAIMAACGLHPGQVF
jgi:hypothetical protein